MVDSRVGVYVMSMGMTQVKAFNQTCRIVTSRI